MKMLLLVVVLSSCSWLWQFVTSVGSLVLLQVVGVVVVIVGGGSTVVALLSSFLVAD